MKNLLLTVLLLLGILPQTAAQDIDDKYASNRLKAGTQAPNFTLRSLDGGKEERLSDHRGRFVLLEFWASWCPDCRAVTPKMKQIQEQYAQKGLDIIGISYDTDSLAWRKYVTDNGLTWSQLSELKKWKKGTITDSLYHISWIPAYYLIDKQGKIIVGTVMIDKILAHLEQLKGDLNRTHCLYKKPKTPQL